MSDEHGAGSHGHGRHSGSERLDELRQMVRDGEIDTLIVALTDMQGRLMGKRVQGQAFLDGVIDHGAHFCTYLLGTDMEMNTPDGLRADELGDRLRRLDRRRRSGTRCGSCPGSRRPRIVLVRRRSTRRPARRSRSRRGRSSSARSSGRPRHGLRASRPARSSSTTCSRTPGRTWPRRASTISSASATTTRTTTSSRRPRPSRSTGCCATR